MSNLKRNIIEGKGIPVQGNDIDTDRIIPARFMKCVTFEGLGNYAFYDERFDEGGNTKKHSFNEEKFLKGSILIVMIGGNGSRRFSFSINGQYSCLSLSRFG